MLSVVVITVYADAILFIAYLYPITGSGDPPLYGVLNDTSMYLSPDFNEINAGGFGTVNGIANPDASSENPAEFDASNNILYSNPLVRPVTRNVFAGTDGRIL